MELAELAEARIRGAGSLPGLLAAAFEGFEVIRLLARASEDRDPALFAAFMATANAAVEGREALIPAPSLPSGPNDLGAVTPAEAEADVDAVTAALAGLGKLLCAELTLAAARCPSAADQQACAEAAEAARRVRGFMAGDGDGSLW